MVMLAPSERVRKRQKSVVSFFKCPNRLGWTIVHLFFAAFHVVAKRENSSNDQTDHRPKRHEEQMQKQGIPRQIAL